MKRFKIVRTSLQFKKIVSITLFWVFLFICQYLYEYAVMVHNDCIPEHFQFGNYFLYTLIATIIGGLVGGAIIVFFLEDWFRSKSYGQALLTTLILHTLVFLFAMSITYSITYSNNLGVSIFSIHVWELFWRDLSTLNYWKNYSLWLLIALVTIAGLFINDKYGPGLLQEFLLGRYFQPKREERIFMFLDLRSSTQIAERLGEEKYFNFVKDVFKDATIAILYYRGEIYKYVGDEIIITWKMTSGLKNANCINCFFQIQETLRQKAPVYQEKYGLVPEFKAGLHYGFVMAGEVGVIKRDIEFSGEVLNIAARIQSKCNELGVDLLFSEYLGIELQLTNNSYTVKEVGNVLLRGKETSLKLFTI